MNFRIIYNDAYKRVIPATLIDSRGKISAIETAGGFAVRDYTNAEVDRVGENVIPYKIETEGGNLVGFFNLVIKFGFVCTLLNKQLRPAFQTFDTQITNKISNFILSKEWQSDILL